MAWPHRVCVLSEDNTYAQKGGAATYLNQTVRLLAARGAELHWLAMTSLGPSKRRVSVGATDRFMAPYASAAFRNVLRVNGYFYALRPGNWLRSVAVHAPPPLARLIPQRPRTDWLPDADQDDLRWAAARIARLAPDMVLANYFNAAAVFPLLPTGIVRAVLVHDVMALLAPVLEAAGAPSYVRLGMADAETAAFRAADLCLAIKDAEAAHIRAVAPGTHVATLPFACDAPEMDLDRSRAPIALFVGTPVHANIDALRWLLEDVWPRVVAARPDARLHVAGGVGDVVPDPWPDGAVRLGFVDDLAACYDQTALALTPVRYGSGVKIKLVEALAHGVPGVATPVGAEGVDGAPPQALRIGADAHGIAGSILDALNAPDAAQARRAARDYARSRFSTETVATALDAALAAARRY